MPLVHPCASDGCNVLTMGEYCLECEQEQARFAGDDPLDTLRALTDEAVDLTAT